MLFGEAQKISQALVFLFGLSAGPGLLLRFGKLGLQRLVFRLEVIVVIHIAVDTLKPVRNGADDLLHGRAHSAGGAPQKSSLAAGNAYRHAGYQNHGKHDDADFYSLFLEVLFQISSTPCFLSIRPSLQSGRPITLKKSPSSPCTKSEASPCAP